MHKPESIQENETYELICDFEIQTDHLIPTRRPDQVLINKNEEICQQVYFTVPADHKVKINEREKYKQILGSCLRSEKTTEHESSGHTNCC